MDTNSNFQPLQNRIKLGYALINFFLGVAGKKWNDMSDDERYEIIKYAGSLI